MTDVLETSPTTGPAATSRASLRVRPIRDEDLPGVARFLAENMPSSTPEREWVAAWKAANNLPGSGAPNHGMLLLSGEEIVGEYAAIYSTRRIAGRTERFCNLAVWCVHPDFRSGSWRMIRALLAQPGYHFTDMDPSPVVQKLNLRMGFDYLRTRTDLALNLPWSGESELQVSSDPKVIERALDGDDLVAYLDHSRAKWARHLVVTGDSGSCYVQWRVAGIKGIKRLAQVQHVSDPALFRSAMQAVSSHLLLHQRMLFTSVDEHVAGGRVSGTWSRQKELRKMFKSDTLSADDIDYLYSEVTAQP